MATFVSDSFTGAELDYLENHSPETGGVWYEHASYNGVLVLTSANRLRQGNAAAGTVYYNDADPGEDNYAVQAKIVVLTDSKTTPSIGVSARIQTATNTRYFTRWLGTNTNAWQLYKSVNGTATSLGTYASDYAVNDEVTFRLRVGTNAQAVDVGAVTDAITASDTAIAARGYAGVQQGQLAAATDTTSVQLDDFLAYNSLSSGRTGTLTATLGALTGSGAGTVAVAGSSAKTLAALTGSGAGKVAVKGSVGKTLAALASSSAGKVSVKGAVGRTLGALSVAASGAIAEGLTGGLTATLGALTGTASGDVRISGGLAASIGPLSPTAAGKVRVAGSSSRTLASLTGAASGAVPARGACGATLGLLTGSCAGKNPVAGGVSATLGGVTCTAVGVIVIPGTGRVQATLEALTGAISGVVPISGAGSTVLASLASDAAGAVPITGSSGVVLGGLACDTASGAVSLSGALASILESLALDVRGTSGAVILPSVLGPTYATPSQQRELRVLAATRRELRIKTDGGHLNITVTKFVGNEI